MSRSTRLTCTPRPARNSSDACSLALGSRLAKPGRCRTSRAVRVAREASTGPRLCCADDSTIGNDAFPTGRGQHASSQMRLRAHGDTQHSSSRNIGRQRNRLVRAAASGKALVVQPTDCRRRSAGTRDRLQKPGPESSGTVAARWMRTQRRGIGRAPAQFLMRPTAVLRWTAPCFRRVVLLGCPPAGVRAVAASRRG